ncbi:RNA polymerase sigma factor [Streptomyces sp. NPDC057837]|uniref:RNA polymerase sigma factor n=1 Tax=Streptomyces sp. NPDC057837 TaxID=3346260 RepID=UPI0036886DED
MDLSLRARIRAGDAQAFAQLFREHAQAVHGHALRWLGDPSTAEDVVSLTFLEAWRLRDRLLHDDAFAARTGQEDDVGDGLRAWLFGIATNVLRNTRRAARRHRAALDRLPDRRTGPDVEPDFADALVGRMEDAERLAAARAALEQLRPREREVFALCVWSGLSYADAAVALDVPVSTVRSRLSRARQRLRRLADGELARRATALPARALPEKEPRRLPARGQEPGDRAEVRSTQEEHR